MSSREQNERKFGQWTTLPSGGRHYWRDIPGRSGWRARYCKEVDASADTQRFWQELYDETGNLVEIHEKFPVDRGHEKV
jgi:hypothetical protein